MNCLSSFFATSGKFITPVSLIGLLFFYSINVYAIETNYSNAIDVGGCTDETACNYDSTATEDDGSCNYTDTDGDGVCDDDEISGCTIAVACNYDSSATEDDDSCDYTSCYVFGCMNTLGCNYNSEADYDDGSCDFTTCAGCMNVLACDFDPSATLSSTCSDFSTCYGCTDSTADNYDPDATIDNGNCDFYGCTITAACNYDSNANTNDSSCEFTSCSGCKTPTACNYDPTYTYHNGLLCEFPEEGYDCDGVCLLDTDNDGVCNMFEIPGCNDPDALNYNSDATDNNGSCTYPVPGCMDSSACNFNFSATVDNGTCEFTSCVGCTTPVACNYDATATIHDGSECEFPPTGYNCGGFCIVDTDGDGVCNMFEVVGCTNSEACNFNFSATEENGSCVLADTGYDCDGGCIVDTDGDGVCDMFEIVGCQDSEACNYDILATDSGSDCTYNEVGYDCDGVCLNDIDNDGVCDEFEILGCTESLACNYDVTATDDDSCLFADTGYDCAGECLNDADADGVCDEFEVDGCTDADACNFNSSATEDDGSCTYSGVVYDCIGNCINDIDNDGVCDQDEVAGCTGNLACNYNEYAIIDDGSCEYVSCIVFGCSDVNACNYDSEADYDDGGCDYNSPPYDCNGDCINDADGDLICDEFEIEGCTDANACNYSPLATDDNGSCTYGCFGCISPDACNFNAGATLDDGTCDFESCLGCTSSSACNYDVTAIFNNGTCVFADEGRDCLGVCLEDADGDDVCDGDEIPGCTNEIANNYDPLATDDDSSCIIIEGCTEGGACNYNSEAGLDDGLCEYITCEGCMDLTACNYDATATIEGDCTFEEFGYDCDGECIVDSDGDGTCDPFEIPGCNNSTACNYEEGTTDNNGTCVYPEDTGNCDCDGNFADALGVCGGDCEADLNANGVCDDLEETGCTAINACNYSPSATLDDSSCDFLSCITFGCTDADACNYDADADYDDGTCDYPSAPYDCLDECVNDEDGDGLCDEFEIPGCTDSAACNFIVVATEDNGTCAYDCYGCTEPTACNYNPTASIDDDSCDFTSCIGCTSNSACNYSAEALFDDGLCVFADPGYDCDGNCLNDSDGDFICDEFEIAGCTDSNANNFDPEATDDDGSCVIIQGCMEMMACNYDATATIAGECTYPEFGYDCTPECIIDTDGDGVCDPFEIPGCTNISACNFEVEATDENGSCYFLEDVDGCDCEGNQLDAIGVCGGACEADLDGNGVCDNLEDLGCTISAACNYDPEADINDGSCDFLSCISFGCTDINACNYDSDADYDDGGCDYNSPPYDCNGDCINDADGDFICDEFEIEGCTDANACNYSPLATDDNGSCTYDCFGCTEPTACNFNPTASIDDGSCDLTTCIGCTVLSACNYDPNAIFDNGLCEYAEFGLDCFGNCIIDTDGDGVCDPFEVLGCTDSNANNFNPEATDDDGSCIIIVGCMDLEACNYDATASMAGECTYPEFGLDCDGNCIIDTDEDGVCDPFEVPGCTDLTACNYNSEATDEDTSCYYLEDVDGCDCDGNQLDAIGVCGGDCEADINENGICDTDETNGCMDSEGCNFNIVAVFDDGSCTYPDTGYDCDGVCLSDLDDDGICDEFEAPIVLIIPENITVECDEVYEGVVTATDGCTIPEVTFTDYVFPGGCPNTSTVFRVYTATDECGNFATDIQQIEIVDTTAPTLIIPEDYTVECELDIVLDDATASDNCSSSVTLEVSDEEVEGDLAGSYLLVRTFTATDECGNASIEIQTITVNSSAEEGDCDCDGNQLDALGICGGDCEADEDGNGICDSEENFGCTDLCACNFNADAGTDDGSCIYDGCNGCTYITAVNYDSNAVFEDGSCQFEGCTDSVFSNYNPFANEQGDFICSDIPGNADFIIDGIIQLQDLLELIIAFGTESPEFGGLEWIQDACLIEPYADEILLDGVGFEEGDESAACYIDEGCMYPLALNFDATASSDGGFCVFPGCIDSEALNFNEISNVDDGTCKYTACPDLNGDGLIQVQDLINFLLVWGNEYPG